MPDSTQSTAVAMPSTPKFVRQDIPSLYVLKALCALFVVLIHVPTEAHLQSLLSPMLYCAVPVFYIITGFFLYKGQYREELRSASKWIRKAFALSLLLNISYFIFYTFLGTKYNLAPTVALSLMFGTGVRTFLWYLTALWEALVIFILLRRYAPRLLLYAPLLFAMNPFLGRYSGIIGINPNSLPNFLLLNALYVALPCIASGYILSQYRRNLVGTYRSKLAFIISVVFLYAEYIFDINFLP